MDTLVALIIIGVCVSLFRKNGVKQSRKKSVPYRRGQVNPKPIHFEPTDPVSVTRVTPAPTVDPEPFCQEAEGFSDEGQGMSHSLERSPDPARRLCGQPERGQRRGPRPVRPGAGPRS